MLFFRVFIYYRGSSPGQYVRTQTFLYFTGRTYRVS